MAKQRFPEIQANSEENNTILAHNQLSGQSAFTDAQKLLIYRAYKKLAAIPLTLANGAYQFQIQVARTQRQGEIITGRIDRQGKIPVQQRKPSIATCPICLAAGTLIDTPAGPVPVEKLQVREMVWTLSRTGKRMAAPVILTGITMVPASHPSGVKRRPPIVGFTRPPDHGWASHGAAASKGLAGWQHHKVCRACSVHAFRHVRSPACRGYRFLLGQRDPDCQYLKIGISLAPSFRSADMRVSSRDLFRITRKG